MRTQTYSTRTAARILAVSPDRIRYWVRRQLVKPARIHGRRYLFAFNDLLVLRLTKELLPNRRRLRRIRRCFERLDRILDSARPMTSLKFVDADGRIVIRDGRLKFEADSGQIILDFDVARFAREAERISRNGKIVGLTEKAERLERNGTAKAVKLYSVMVASEPRKLEFRLRLGESLRKTEDFRGALRQYLFAAAIAPRDAGIQFTIGALHRQRGHPASAIRSFLRAVTLEPRMADAHRQLAELYEELGRKRDSLRHLSELRRLTRSS